MLYMIMIPFLNWRGTSSQDIERDLGSGRADTAKFSGTPHGTVCVGGCVCVCVCQCVGVLLTILICAGKQGIAEHPLSHSDSCYLYTVVCKLQEPIENKLPRCIQNVTSKTKWCIL